MSNHRNFVFFSFFIILAATLNFGFSIGDLNNPSHHSIFELFFAIIVNIIAFSMKLGSRSQMDATQLATSAASCLQLIIASLLWTISSHNDSLVEFLPSIVSLSWGAFVANVFSIIILIIDSIITKRVN